jgi:hypothetical protein
VVQSWWLDEKSAEKLFQHTAETIQYHQGRNAQARVSHTKTAKRKLEQQGIDLSTLEKADFDTS